MLQTEMTRRMFFHRLMETGALIITYTSGFPHVLADVSGCRLFAGKRLRWIVPHAPGGGYDTYSRLIAPFFAKALKADVVIENIPGAGGIVGAKTIQRAEPDGLTLGILDGSGILVASLAGEVKAPDIANEFETLVRIARSRQIWAVSSTSPFYTISDALNAASKRPLIFGTLNVASLSFCNIVVTSHLLGVDAEIVAGYRGSKAGVLAVQRGDVEIISYSFESILRHIETGDIRPLLQISNEPISAHPALKGIPILGGDRGLASLQAEKMGRNKQEADLDVSTLMAIIDVGRLVVIPKGLAPEWSSCLGKAMLDTLSSQDFKMAAAKANRSLDVAGADTVKDALLKVARRADVFSALIRGAIEKVRS